METLRFHFVGGTPRPVAKPCLVGLVASGNLEVLVEPADLGGACVVEVNTNAKGFGANWAAVLQGFHTRHRLCDVRISINDGGATPAVIALRLDQAAATWLASADAPVRPRRFRTATARERLAGLLDDGRWEEFLPPSARVTSPHLAEFDLPAAFDDGVVVGHGMLAGKAVLFAAQEGRFMGGAAGEVHSAKIVGLLRRAARDRPAAVLLLLDSGGVRLHEANAALIGVSEVLRGVLALRGLGVPVLALIGGANGCFGGVGIVARCCDTVIMSEEGRLGLSGPEVIETAHGPEEFDSTDRDLVWRTMGGRHRYLLGDCDRLVADDIGAFTAAALAAMTAAKPFNLEALGAEHANLTARALRFGACRKTDDLWRLLGASDPAALATLALNDFLAAAAALRFDGRCDAAAVRPAGDPLENGADTWRALADRLFPEGHAIRCAGQLLAGEARVSGQNVAVVGTSGHAPIGFEIALALAGEVLRVIREESQRPLVILVDTQGHRLSRRDELLGLTSFMAHLAMCIDLARHRGHRVVGLVYDQAVSGGFFVTGLMADACHALPATTIHVMDLRAMARVMRMPEARLVELARSHPVFAPGVENFVRMGALESIFNGDLSVQLARAIRTAGPNDRRSALGLERGGRALAHLVAQKVAEIGRPAV